MSRPVCSQPRVGGCVARHHLPNLVAHEALDATRQRLRKCVQLIRDQRHRNPMDVAALTDRMKGWLGGREYRAVLFENAGEIAAYALYREEQNEIYLRQFFVVRHCRRRNIGRKAAELLQALWPKNRRLTVEVLAGNAPALAFFRAVGYVDYSICLEILPSKETR